MGQAGRDHSGSHGPTSASPSTWHSTALRHFWNIPTEGNAKTTLGSLLGHSLGSVYPLGAHPVALPPARPIPPRPGHRTRPGMLQGGNRPFPERLFWRFTETRCEPRLLPSIPPSPAVFQGQPARFRRPGSAAAPAPAGLRSPGSAGSEHPPLTRPPTLRAAPCLSLSVLELWGCPWSSGAVPGALGLSLMSPAAALPAHLPGPGMAAAAPHRPRCRGGAGAARKPQPGGGRGRGRAGQFPVVRGGSREVPGGSGKEPGAAWALLPAGVAAAERERCRRCGPVGAAGRAAGVGKTRSSVKIHPKTAICAH